MYLKPLKKNIATDHSVVKISVQDHAFWRNLVWVLMLPCGQTILLAQVADTDYRN